MYKAGGDARLQDTSQFRNQEPLSFRRGRGRSFRRDRSHVGSPQDSIEQGGVVLDLCHRYRPHASTAQVVGPLFHGVAGRSDAAISTLHIVDPVLLVDGGELHDHEPERPLVPEQQVADHALGVVGRPRSRTGHPTKGWFSAVPPRSMMPSQVEYAPIKLARVWEYCILHSYGSGRMFFLMHGKELVESRIERVNTA